MEARFQFVRDESTGEVKEAVIEETGFLPPLRAERITAASTDPATWQGYVGDYWSDELRVTYRISAENGGLRLKELIGADGFVHEGIIPFAELRPVRTDEFYLEGAPLVFRFLRDDNRRVSGLVLNGFHEAGIGFARAEVR